MLTYSEDHFTVDRVAEALIDRGARPIRIDTDQYPKRVQFTAELLNGRPTHVIRDREMKIASDEVRAVWLRHVASPNMSEALDPQYKDMCRRESQLTLRMMLGSLSDVRWVNDPTRTAHAEMKLRQLGVARSVGLRVPKTLVSNDPLLVREFFGRLSGKVVAKLLTGGGEGPDGTPMVLFTNEVSADDLIEADALRHCPMVFQERIPKRRELRVVFVNGRFFVGAVDASGSEAGKTDWRLAKPEECQWEVIDLPSTVARNTTALMEQLGLVFGAIDMIETPDGEHVFLEVNPSGEWGMLERDLSLPISEAIADALLV